MREVRLIETIYSRDESGRLVLDTDRLNIQLPCGHRTRPREARVHARDHYTCGACYAERAEWVTGYLDPAWIIEPEPPAAPKPRLTVDRLDIDARIAASRRHLKKLIAEHGYVSRQIYDRARPADAYAWSTFIDRVGRPWSAITAELGGISGHEARRRKTAAKWAVVEQQIRDVAAVLGHPPTMDEWDIHRPEGAPNATVARSRYGTWAAALKTALSAASDLQAAA